MKLWIKSMLALGTVGATSVGALGGLLAYSKSDKSKGNPHFTARGLKNSINDFKEIDKYNIEFVSSITKEKIGNYDYDKNEINGVSAEKWVKEYLAKGNGVPVLHVNAGPILFENFYPEAIFPKDFVNFVEWFSEEVSWSADISSLSYFRIKRGIEKGETGRTVTLGSYAADKQTTKRIQFIPDSFYGEVGMSNFALPGTKGPISKKELEAFVENFNETNEFFAGHPEKMLKIYSVEKVGDGYIPMIAHEDNFIFDLEKENASSTKIASDDLDVVTDPKTGISKLVNRPGKHLLIKDQNIPRLSVYRTLAGDDWEGLNFGWLKYVTQHEYGHMQTMGMASDGATSPINLGPSRNASPSATVPSSSYDLDELNSYLAARIPSLKALRANVNLTEAGINGSSTWDFYEDHKNDPNYNPKHFQNIAWELDTTHNPGVWTRETIEGIFGSSADVEDPNSAPYHIDPDEFLKNIRAGKPVRFFTRSITDQRSLANALGIPLAATYIMNSFDNLMATTSAGFSTDEVEEMRFIDSNEVDVEKRKWVTADETVLNLKSWNGVQLFKSTVPKNYTDAQIIEKLKDKFSEVIQLETFGRAIVTPDYSDLPTQIETYLKQLSSDPIGKNVWPTVRELMDSIDSITGTFEEAEVEKLNNFLRQQWKLNWWVDNTSFKVGIGTDVMNTSTKKTYTINEIKDVFKAFFVEGGFTTPTIASPATNTEVARLSNTELTKVEADAFLGTLAGKLTKAEVDSLLTDFGFPPTSLNTPGTDRIDVDTPYIVRLKSGYKYFELNPNAKDKEGNFILGKPELEAKFRAWFNFVIQGQWNRAIEGREALTKDTNKIEQDITTATFEAQAKDPASVLGSWLNSPNEGIPPDLASLFANYTYNFAEIMTRDWVQMTYKQEYSVDEFRYQSSIAPVAEINTGIELYLDPSSLIKSPARQQEIDGWFTGFSATRKAWYGKFALTLENNADRLKILEDSLKNQSFVTISDVLSLWAPISNLLKGKSAGAPITYQSAIYTGTPINGKRYASFKSLITSPSITNNGYNVDRWLRASLATTPGGEGTADSWAIYNNNGESIQDTTIRIKDFNGTTVSDRARAYWVWFLRSRGVGERTISKIWRVPDRDAFAMWGYIRREWEGKLENLTFTNKATGERKSFPVTIGGNNLFYFKHQGGGSKNTLADDGYTSWTVDYLSLGTWYNASVSNGEWGITFTDKEGNDLMQGVEVDGVTGNGHEAQNGQKSKQLFDLGNKERITENGFDEGFAPVIINNEKGIETITVKDQFPI